MKTSLSVRSSSPVPLADSGASQALAAAKNMLTRDYPAQPEYLLEPMGDAVRGALERRRAELDNWLRPASKADYPQITKAIAEMLGAFAANSSGSAQAIVAKYLHIVQDLPSWAIMRACSMIERGEAEAVSLDFRPSAPRLRDVAKIVMGPWLEELAQIKGALLAEDPRPEDADMRERVGRLFSELSSTLKGKVKKQSASA